jgi:hypothetical protein
MIGSLAGSPDMMMAVVTYGFTGSVGCPDVSSCRHVLVVGAPVVFMMARKMVGSILPERPRCRLTAKKKTDVLTVCRRKA